jgi:transcriptional regulator with XRE-family HTH domain
MKGMEVYMELNENLKNNLLRLRKERNVTQEVLAIALDISVQAISKWETGVSLPDIMQLPRIAQFYGVTIDYLFFNEGNTEPAIYGDIPDDNKLRIIQFRGNTMLGVDLWERDKKITLKIPEETKSNMDKEFNIEVWGNAEIHGDINGYAESGGGINCGNIGQYAECGGSVNCGNIGQYVECGGSVNCGNIGQNVECGSSVNSGSINGNVECNRLNCGDIGGQVECEGDIRCRSIKGDVHCEGNITYER